MPVPWKLLDRKKVFDSKFVRVYEDRVELPDHSVIDDYTVIEKGDVIVMVVATDTNGNLIAIREYKHGVQKVLWSIPAGHVEKGETPIKAAKRELREETGASGGTFEEVGILYDYPSKDTHSVSVVRATGVRIDQATAHEATESIVVEILPIETLKQQVRGKEWQLSTAIAALTIAGICS